MVHLHIWPPPIPEPADDPIAEIDFEEFDRQPNMSTPPADDGYIQFSGIDPLTGNSFELRIGNELIKKLAKELESK